MSRTRCSVKRCVAEPGHARQLFATSSFVMTTPPDNRHQIAATGEDLRGLVTAKPGTLRGPARFKPRNGLD
ncbi:hypothetical protein ACVIIV_002087 [Bradyrhizobium sp. USDA 4354]